MTFATTGHRPVERWQANLIQRNNGTEIYVYGGQSQNQYLNGARVCM